MTIDLTDNALAGTIGLCVTLCVIALSSAWRHRNDADPTDPPGTWRHEKRTTTTTQKAPDVRAGCGNGPTDK